MDPMVLFWGWWASVSFRHGVDSCSMEQRVVFWQETSQVKSSTGSSGQLPLKRKVQQSGVGKHSIPVRRENKRSYHRAMAVTWTSSHRRPGTEASSQCGEENWDNPPQLADWKDWKVPNSWGRGGMETVRLELHKSPKSISNVITMATWYLL